MTAEPNQFVTRSLSVKGWTDQAVTQLSCKWTIQNFLFYEKNDVIESPKFQTDSGESQCLVRFQRTQGPYDSKDYVVLCSSPKLNSASLPPPPTVKFIKCSVINSEGEEEAISNTTSNCLCPKEELLWRENDLCNLLPNGALTLQFEIQVIGLESSINNDFNKLLNNQEYCDVTIIAGNKKFKAHKLVLAARSSVFSAMFKHGMKESETNEVVIPDVKSEILEKMLLFIYTDELPKNQDGIEICKDLLIAADKYALNKLKYCCEKAVFAKTTIENAAEMLQLADLHQAKQLSEHLQDFFCQHSEEILDTPEFKLLLNSHPRLVFPLLCKMSSLVSSNDPEAKRQKTA